MQTRGTELIMLGAVQESRAELDRLTSTVDALGLEMERLNAEILYWKSETDKRKIQLGEHHLLDDDADDGLWRRLAAREVAEARERVAKNPEIAMALITELVRDKRECMVSGVCCVLWGDYTCNSLHSRCASHPATAPSPASWGCATRWRRGMPSSRSGCGLASGGWLSLPEARQTAKVA